MRPDRALLCSNLIAFALFFAASSHANAPTDDGASEKRFQRILANQNSGERNSGERSPKGKADNPESHDETEASLRERASRLYARGARAFAEKRYGEAAQLFGAADEILPSAALSYNTALAYENLGDVPGALRSYRDYLRRAPATDNAASVRERVAELESELARRGVQQVTVLSKPRGADVLVDGRLRGVTPWSGELRPGEHELAVRLKGHRQVRRDFSVPKSRSVALKVILEPMMPSRNRSRLQAAADVSREQQRGTADQQRTAADNGGSPWPWITLTASGVSLLTAGGFELLRREAEEDARASNTQLAYEANLDTMKARQTGARVFAGIGGALLLTSGVLLVLEPDGESSGTTAALACTSTACSGAVKGKF